MQLTEYDVIIVGGGAAALSAALVLGRMRVSVLVIDGGEPRNRFSHSMHGFISRDGMNPRDLLVEARRELGPYGVNVRAGYVESIGGQLGAFTVDADIGIFAARRLIIATGLTDRLPELDGLQELWGTLVVHCPFCHGWELRDRHVAVLVWHPLALHQVSLMSRLTSAIDVIPLGITLDRVTAATLAARNISILEINPISVKRSDDGGVILRGQTGTSLRFDAVLCGGWPVANDGLLRSMGCALSKIDMPFGDGFVAVTATGETSVPGLYAVGNVIDASAQVIAAAAQGSTAAIAIVQAIVHE